MFRLLPRLPRQTVIFYFEKIKEVIKKVNLVALITLATMIIIPALRQQNQRSWTGGVL